MEKRKSIVKAFLTIMLVIMLVMLTGCGSDDKKDKEKDSNSSKEYSVALDNYFKGLQEADAKKIISAYHDFYIEYYDYEDLYDDEYVQDRLEELEDEYGDNIKISYEVAKEEKIEGDDIKNVQKYIKEYYDESVKVEAGYKIKVKASIKGDDDKESNSNVMYVYKINGKWGILDIDPETAGDYIGEYSYDEEDEDADDDKEDVEIEEDDDSNYIPTSSAYMSAIDNYFKGMEKYDVNMFLDAFPDFYKDLIGSVYDNDSMQELMDSFVEDYGSNIKILYNVTSEKVLTSTELQNIQDYIEKQYDEKVSVTDGYEVEIEATIKGDSNSETDTDTMYVYKIDGKWCILMESPDSAASYLN